MSPRDELTHLLGKLDDDSQEMVRRLAEGLAADASGARSNLLSVVQELGDQHVDQLLGVARAMALPIDETIDSKSMVITAEFAAELRARLQAHHATHTTPMDRLSFENAFLAASRAVGRATDEAPSRTTRFFDATVDGEQVALKTEGAKSMKADRLQVDPAPHYELVEIPMSHFEVLKAIPASAFNADAPRIKVEDARGPIMEFRIDRSDSKITVGKVEKQRCIVHGDWRLTGLDSTMDVPAA